MNTLEDLKAKAPDASCYLDRAGAAILSATLAFDYGRAAEKMVDPNCAGANNPAWQTGPFLTVFQGAQPISKTAPSVLHPSIETSVASKIVNGEENDKIGLPQPDAEQNQMNHIIAKLAIIEQVQLLRSGLQEFNHPCSLEAIEKILPSQQNDVLKTLKQIFERGDELMKDPMAEAASMREAIDIFYAAAQSVASLQTP